MALSHVEQAVLGTAETEAEKILERGRREAEELLARQTARLREEHARRVVAMRRELEAELERETGAREIANRREVLKVKNDIIQEVFERAVEGVVSLPDNGYAKWLKARVAALPGMDGATLAGNKRDRALLAEAVSAAGRTDLKIDEEPAALKGGFFVRGAQVDFDVSIEALMASLRESLAEDIAQRLFAEVET